jgi:hypothetical protein
MLVASLFSAFYNQTPTFRTQDVMFGGLIFNLAFAFALAYEPRSVKNLRDKYPFASEKPSINDFMYPLMFAVGGGIALFVCQAATKSYTSTIISLTLMLFLYACSVGGHGSVFATKRFGNRLLYLCGFGALSVILTLVFTTFGHSVFGYGVPEMSKLALSVTVTVAYFIITQLIRYFLSPNGKAKKDTSEEPEAEAVETAEEGYEDDEEEIVVFDDEE